MNSIIKINLNNCGRFAVQKRQFSMEIALFGCGGFLASNCLRQMREKNDKIWTDQEKKKFVYYETATEILGMATILSSVFF